MAHHGPNPFDGDKRSMEEIQKRNDLMRDLLDATKFRGAIGDFPEGKLTKQDEGAIQFAIGEAHGKVVVDFGTSVHWLGMTPQQAADFASTILKRARLVARKSGETVGFTIG
jgi:hypothetical protein